MSRTALDRLAPVEGFDLLLVVVLDNAAKCERPPDRSAEIVMNERKDLFLCRRGGAERNCRDREE